MKLSDSPNIEKLKKKRNIKGLLKILNHETYEYVHKAIIALGELGDKTAIEPLIALLNDDTQSGHLGVVITALGELGAQAAVEQFIAFLEDEKTYATRHTEIINALRKIGDPRSAQPLIKALNEQPTLREAAEALGELGDSSAIEPLASKLGEGWEDDREAVEIALIKLGKDSINPCLKALKYGEERETRESAAKVLGRLGDNRAVGPLIVALNDIDGMVRQAAARALGRIGDMSAVKALISKIEYEPAIKIALMQIGGEEAEKAVYNYWLENPYAPDHWQEETILPLISRARKLSDSKAIEALTILERYDSTRIQEEAADAIKCIDDNN